MVIHPPLFKWQYLHKKERRGPFETSQRYFFVHMVFPVYLGTALAQRSTATTILASKPSPIYPASIVVNSSMPFQDILILSTSTDLYKPNCNSLVHKTAPDRSGEHKKCIGGWKLAGYVIDEGEIPPSSVEKGQRALNWRNAVLVGHENQMEECRCPKVSSSRSPPFEGRQESIFVFGIFAICFLKSRKQMSTMRTRCVRMVSTVFLEGGESNMGIALRK